MLQPKRRHRWRLKCGKVFWSIRFGVSVASVGSRPARSFGLRTFGGARNGTHGPVVETKIGINCCKGLSEWRCSSRQGTHCRAIAASSTFAAAAHPRNTVRGRLAGRPASQKALTKFPAPFLIVPRGAFAPLAPLGQKDHHKLRCGELMRPVREGTCGYNRYRLRPPLSL